MPLDRTSFESPPPPAHAHGRCLRAVDRERIRLRRTPGARRLALPVPAAAAFHEPAAGTDR